MKKNIFLLSLFCINFNFAQNLIQNGDFANGSTSWTLTGGSVVAGEAFFATTNAGGDPWSTQLTQNNFAFTAGVTYTLTFKARATANRNITVALQRFNIWSEVVPNQVHALTTNMQTFTQSVAYLLMLQHLVTLT